MAKRKLTADQRATLRKDLAAAVKGEAKVANVLRDIAKKYGITTITARWYLNSLDGVKKRKRGRKPGRPAGSRNGDIAKFVEEQATKAREASRLVPRWQKLIDRESELRRLSLKLGRRLEATSKKASKLRSKIQALVGS